MKIEEKTKVAVKAAACSNNHASARVSATLTWR